MNKQLLVTSLFVSVTLGAYSSPIFTIFDLNSSILLQNESDTDKIESVGEKLLAFDFPKNKSKSSKKTEEDYVDDEDDDESVGEATDSNDDDIDDADDDDDDDDFDQDDDIISASSSSDDDDLDSDGDDNNVSYSKSGGFADIKSKLDKRNKNLPESKNEYHIHKNAPARTVTNKLDPQGAMTEYITYFYGDEIEMKHTVSFLANGNVNINGTCKANFTTNTPSKSWSNSRTVNGQTVMEFYYFNGKIKASFTLTPLRNGTTNVNYNTSVVDPNI